MNTYFSNIFFIKYVFALIFIFFLCSSSLFAQVEIKGTVKDSENMPLIGASIVIKGTQSGTITNSEGEFSIKVPDMNAILAISFIGYLDEELELKGQTEHQITLIEDLTGLDEVVVIGYGTQRKRDLTGAIVSVDDERLQDISANNLLGALQGSVAGMSISTSSGRPGSGSDVLIRGLKSLRASNDPLVIVDGIPGASLDDVHPSDIESVEVLKDASATSIYGSRAAGGVIIVTTKKGSLGKLTVNYDFYYGLTGLANKVDILSPDEYIAKKREIYRMENSSFRDNEWMSYDSSLSIPVSEFLVINELEMYDSARSYNWLDEVTRRAPIQSHNLSLSGGGERTQYFLSASYVDQTGVIYSSNYRKYSARANISSKFTKWFKVGTNILINRAETKAVDDQIFAFTYQISPLGKKYENEATRDEYTLYPMHTDDYIGNPFTEFEKKDITLHTQILNNTFLEFTPLTGLTYRISLNTIANIKKINKFIPLKTRQVEAFDNYENASIEYRDDININLDNLVTYHKSFGSHIFNATFVFSAEEYKRDKLYSFAKNFGTDYHEWTALQYGQIDFRDISSEEERSYLISYIGRLNYNYRSKYLIQFSLRNDRSSRFSEENRNALFPGISLGWVASDEAFLDNVNVINNLKLRLSWGKTGNQAVNYHDRFNVGTKVYYTTGKDMMGSIVEGLVQTDLANKDLRWETSEEYNVGIDFALFQSRLSGVIEFYKITTTDLLWERTLSPITGFPDIMDNIGSLENKGIEVSLHGNVIDKSDFNLMAYGTFSLNRNKILDLDGSKTDDIPNRLFIDEPVGVVYDYEFDGILQEGEEPPYYMPDLIPGEAKVKNHGSFITLEDESTERSSDPDSVINEADMKIIGQIHPKWYSSLGFSFSYKNLELSMFFNHVHGITRRIPIGLRDRPHSMDIPYYTDEHPSSQYGRPAWPRDIGKTGNYYGRTSYYVDGSYTRLQDATLAYTFKGNLLLKAGISRLRLYLTGQNLFTITDYKGYDPAIEYENNQREGNIDKIAGYPTIRSFILGVNLTF